MIIPPQNRAVFAEQLRQRNRRGRPRVIQGPVVVRSVRVPVGVFDALCRLAIHGDRSVDSEIRTALAAHVRSRIL